MTAYRRFGVGNRRGVGEGQLARRAPTVRLEAWEREHPKEAKAQESQDAALREKSCTRRPNRQREQTPEARSLSAAMPHAYVARQHRRSERDQPFWFV